MRRRLIVLSILAILGTSLLPLALADPASPITISNIDSPDPVASGAQITYTITVVNTAGSKVTNVVLSDQLNGVGGIGVPPQLQITSSRGSCAQSTTLVTCNAGTMEGGGSWIVTIRGVVTAANGTSINNTVSVSGTHSAQNFTTTNTITTQVAGGSGSPLPDLTIDKVGPTNVTVSSPMTYTLTVNNIGTANATNVKVVDTVPLGLTLITATGTSLFTCSVSGQTVTCVGGAVNFGSNASITINATAPATTGTITNTASVDPDNTITEGNELNNTSALVNTTVTSAAPPPQMLIDVTDDPLDLAGAGPDPVTPGDQLTYKILVTNNTGQRADDIVITDGTQGLVASSMVVTQIITNGTLGVTGGCSNTASEAKCSSRTLNPGGTILMTVTGSVIASAGSTLINTATVTANIKNKGTSSTDTELTTVKPGVDLTVTKADSPDPVCASSWPGGSVPPPAVCRGGLTYTFVVGNSGIYAANNVLLRDPLPAGTFFDSFTAPAFSGGCSVDGNNVLTCTGGTVAPQSTTTVTIVLVAPPGTGTISNTVTVDPNNAIFESDETNNFATAATLVTTGIDLTIKKTDATPGFDPIATSGTQTYTITVDNIGTQDATNVSVRDILPAGTIFRSAQGDHGFTCSYSNGNVDCVGASIRGTANRFYPNFLGPGTLDTATITIRVFAQPIIGLMHNEVRVDPFNTIPEADETNNIAFQDTTVVPGGAGSGAFNQFTIKKTELFPPQPPIPPFTPVARNARMVFSIVVVNDGTDPATGVTVRDFLPAGARYIEATGTNHFLCSQVSNYINCTGGELAAGGSATLTISMFAPDTPGDYTNQAIVDPDNAIPEGNEFDNQSSWQFTVTNGGAGAYNDLSIHKDGPLNTFPNGPIQYTLTVSNGGAADALNVTVRDVLPPGVTFLQATQSGATGAAFTCNEAGGVVNCTGGTITASGSRVIVIDARAPNHLVQAPDPPLHNVAVVDPDNTIPEGDEFNNTSNPIDTTVTSKLNLTIKKDGPDNASQSDVTDYTITVTNNTIYGGGAVAQGVVVVDTLPPGLIPLAVTAGSSNNWACQIFENPVNVVRCVGDLNAGGAPQGGDSVEIKITVFITAEDGRPLDNTACVDPDNTIVESNELDNCSDLGTFIQPAIPRSPNLLVSKSVDNVSTSPGADLIYTISISNTGNAKAQGWNGTTGLTLTDNLPPEVTFTNTETTNNWTCTESSGHIVCHDDGSGMSPGASAEVKIHVHVKDTAHNPIANTASADLALVDDPTACASAEGCTNETGANFANNTSTVVSSIGSSGLDLAISTITDVPDPVAPGQPLKYTIVAVNGGTVTATDVHIEVDIPTTGVTFVSADGSNGFNCGAPSSGSIDCVGSLPGGGNTTITVNFVVLLSGLPPDLTLKATIDPSLLFAEIDEGNNSQTATTTISSTGACTACVDLVASQLFGTPDPVHTGDPLKLTFQIANTGDEPAVFSGSNPLLWFDTTSNGALAVVTPVSSDPAITCAVDFSAPGVLQTHCSGTLAPFTSATITISFPSVSGTKVITKGTLDPLGLVLESSETNNILDQSIVVLP